MPYTHDFEIELNGISIAGEIDFENTGGTMLKTNAGEEMRVKQRRKFQAFLEQLISIRESFGEIVKIEISLKAP